MNPYGLYQNICQEWKRTRKPVLYNKDIRPGYRNRIRHAHNEKWEMRSDGRNTTAKLRKHQNA